MSKLFKELILDEVDKGIAGENIGIPTPLKKVSKIINNIQQRIYTLIGGNSGTGKTAFVDFNYVLLPYMWYKKNQDKTDIKLKIIYYSMERSKRYKIQKWLCLYLYILSNFKTLLDVPTLNGWEGKTKPIDDSLRQQIISCETFIEELLSDNIIDIIDGQQNPTGIYKHARDLALENGKEDIIIHKKPDGSSYSEIIYTPNNKKQYTLVVLDHIGKLKIESEPETKRKYSNKENIDKMSEYLGTLRDRYGFSPVVLSQFNRALSDSQRMRNKEVAPEPDDFKNSGNMYEDCDLSLALFNPFKLKVKEDLGYKPYEFVNKRGYNRFRSMRILKNSYGVDDVGVGLKFIGECGYFSELPKPDDTVELDKIVKNLI